MASRTLTINVVGDPSSASRMFKKVGDDADRAGHRVTGFATVSQKGLGRVGIAMGGLATAGAGAVALLGKSFITAASDINESLTKNQVLFGRYSQDIVKFSDQSAKAFGLSKQAALEYTGTFGNLFRSMGTSRQESAKFSVGLTKLAADMASFNNTSIEDALEAIRSGLVGESEPLRRFGVNLNDASLRQQALKMGLVSTTKDALDPQTKALATMSLVTKQTSAAHGDFARTSGGLANQMRILKARLADAGAELGTKLLPFALKAATALNRLIDQAERGKGPFGAIRRAFAVVSDALGDATTAVNKWGKENRQELTSIQRAQLKARDTFIRVREALDPLFGVMGRNATAMWRTITHAFDSIIDLLQGDFKGALRDALQSARQYFGGLGRYALQFLKVLNDAKKEFIGVGRQIGKWIVDGITGAIKSAPNSIADTLKGAISGDAKPFLGIGDGIGKRVLPSMGAPGLGGGALMGADPDLAPFAAAGSRFGLRVSSGLRPGSITSSGNQSFHATGDAIDEAGSAGGMLGYFRFLKQNFGSRLRELIYTPGGVGIKDGRPFRYTGEVAADHYDHVHVAYTGPFGDGIGEAARAAKAAGFRGRDLVTAVAVAGPESGYRNRARLLTGAEDSRGDWQINTFAHPWAAGMNLYNPFVNARAAKRVHDQAGGWGPWSAFTSGRYRAFLSRARVAVAALSSGGAPSAGGGGGGSAGKTKPGGSGIPTGNVKPGGRGIPTPAVNGLGDAPSGTDYIDALIAEAALTSGTGDDIAAQQQAVAYWRQQRATAGADPRSRAAAATGLKGALDQLEALTGALETANRIAEQDRTSRAEVIANQRELLRLARTQPAAIFGALAAAMDASIGGRVGLGYQSVGYAGNVAAY